MQDLIEKLVAATNAFDVQTTLALFAAETSIDDISVGRKFPGAAGVQTYIEHFFVGYHTVTKIESIELLGERRAIAHLDFTGDFGHETGFLDIKTDRNGLITRIKADLN